jgi:hypothetical protein
MVIYIEEMKAKLKIKYDFLLLSRPAQELAAKVMNLVL